MTVGLARLPRWYFTSITNLKLIRYKQSLDTASRSSTIEKSLDSLVKSGKRKPHDMFKARKARPEPRSPEKTYSSSEVATSRP